MFFHCFLFHFFILLFYFTFFYFTFFLYHFFLYFTFFYFTFFLFHFFFYFTFLIIFHCILNGCKSPQLSRIHLGIFADFSSAVVSFFLKFLFTSVFLILSKCFDYDWYYYHFHITQLFKLSGKVQILLELFDFLYFNFWNGKVY